MGEDGIGWSTDCDEGCDGDVVDGAVEDENGGGGKTDNDDNEDGIGSCDSCRYSNDKGNGRRCQIMSAGIGDRLLTSRT